jgi:Zn-dependent protease
MLTRLAGVNLFLALFIAIPASRWTAVAFLRALRANRMGFARATPVAASKVC